MLLRPQKEGGLNDWLYEEGFDKLKNTVYDENSEPPAFYTGRPPPQDHYHNQKSVKMKESTSNFIRTQRINALGPSRWWQ